MIGDTAQIAVELKLKDQQFQSSIAKDERSLQKLNSTVTRTGGAFSQAAGHVGSFSKNMGRAVGNLGKGLSTAAHNIERLAFVGGALAVGGGIAAIKWAGDFEAQLRTINTIARETPEGLNRIGDSIRQIARETGTPLEELTQGYYDLLSAGIKAADAQNVLTNANKLAIGGLGSAAETVDLLTTAINVYGGDARQAGRFTDEFAKAIERGKVTAAELAGSYAMVAPLAKSLNIENKELAAGYARLTASGTPAAEAATQMASAMTALLKKTPDLEKLEKQTKKNYAAIAGSQGFNVALEQMQVDAQKAGIDLVKLVGRKEALLYILQTTGPNLKAYNADLAAMGNAAGTAAEQMSERQQGLNFQLARLKAGIHDAGITIGTALIPKLVPLIEHLNTFLNENQGRIKQFGADLASAFEQAAAFASKLDFGQIGDSLKVAATFGKALISAFLSAPQWLQTAVVTGWGLNKLTGGAVQNIMADLTKAAVGGVLQQFVQRGSSPANPLFVADVTGGLGKGLPGLAAGGAGAALAAVAAPIAAVGAVGITAVIQQGQINDQAVALKQQAADYAAVASDKALAQSVDGVSKQLAGMQFNTFNSKNAVVAVLNTLIAEQNRREATRFNTATGFAMAGAFARDTRINAQTGFWTSGVFSKMSDAMAIGIERGIVHSGVFKQAQAVRDEGKFRTSIDALNAQLAAARGRANPRLGAARSELAILEKDLAGAVTRHDVGLVASDTKKIEALKKEIVGLKSIPGKRLGTDALVTGEAIALATINHLRIDRNPDLKSAKYHLAELNRLQKELPADLARQLNPKIHSLEVAINRATAAIKAIPRINTSTGFVMNGPYSDPRGPRPPSTSPQVNSSTGFVTNVKVTTSTRDQTTAAIVRSRHGPTPAQAGAA